MIDAWCVDEDRMATLACGDQEHVITVVERVIGPIEEAIRQDIGSLGDTASRAGRRTLAAMALKLARALDVRGDDEAPSQTAKAVDTLRITLRQMMQGDDHDPDLARQIAELLGTPSAGGAPVSAEVRYPKKPRAADAGPGGRADSNGFG